MSNLLEMSNILSLQSEFVTDFKIILTADQIM